MLNGKGKWLVGIALTLLAAQAALVVLRLERVIAWSWWAVLVPLWIGLVLIALLVGLIALVASAWSE